jgi:hypothetical protein
VIVKVQRSLTNPPSILVYDEPKESLADGMITHVHEIFAQLPMSPGDIARILGDDLKGYFEATLVRYGATDSTIEIGDRVPDEDW